MSRFLHQEHHVGFPEDVSHEDLVNSTMFIPSSVVMEKLGRHLSRLLYMPPDPPVAELPFELQYPLNPDIDWAVLEQAVRREGGRVESAGCGVLIWHWLVVFVPVSHG